MFWATTTILALLLAGGGGVLVWWASGRLDRFGNVARSLGRARDYRDMRGTRRPAPGAVPAALAGRTPGGGPRRHRAAAGPARAGTTCSPPKKTSLLHIAGPRSNKTSALVVPAVLSAPGPLIATSNKVDLHILTCRAARPGRAGCSSSTRNTSPASQQTWWWNPLAAIRDVADAHHLVAHFSHTVGAGHERADPYFTKGAERLLAQLCLAAAVSGRHLRDVQHWLATRSDTPVQLLRDAGQHRGRQRRCLGTLEARPDQRGGLYETALTAIACLESEAVLRYVTPPATWLTRPPGRADRSSSIPGSS